MFRILKKFFTGFTLLETLLASVIAVIILSSITMFFLDMMKFKQRFLIEDELQYGMRFAIQKISEEIKIASGVDQAQSIFVVHPGKIKLTYPSGIESPRIIQSDGEHLTLKRGNAAPLNLLPSRDRVKSFMVQFSRPNQSAGLVTGTLALQSAVDSRYEKTETFTVSLSIFP